MMWRKGDVIKSKIKGREQKRFLAHNTIQQDLKTKAFEWLITKSQLSAPELQHCVLYSQPHNKPIDCVFER